VKIPAGVDNGQRLRVPGQGEHGYKGGSSGDLYVEFRVKPHEFYEREGFDIFVDMPVHFTQAVFGDDIEVPTLHGKVKLKVPAGTQTGTQFRLRQKGVPFVRGNGTGDQNVTVKIITPTKLTDKQKTLLREYADVSEKEGQEENFFQKVKRAFKGD
jgi:molecular chaperone DnaJ